MVKYPFFDNALLCKYFSQTLFLSFNASDISVLHALNLKNLHNPAM